MPAIFWAILGGATNGSFAAPLKKMHGWAWEHSWFVWAFSGLVCVPGIAALATIPNLFSVYSSTSWNSLGLVAFFGFGWGVSGLLFGIGIDRLGLALGYGIIIGISSALGAVGPLVTKHPEQIMTPTGLQTLGGVLLVVAGVAACTAAGRMREKAGGAGQQKGSLTVGLLICFASGVGAPMMNFGLAYATEITDAARQAGAADGDLTNAVWPVLLAAGFVANAGYCLILMVRGSGFGPILEVSPAANIPLGFLMGLLWMGGLLMYGYASRQLGPMGLILGWPVMMASTVVTANAWGAATGEWKGAPSSAKVWVWSGVALLIAGVSVISAASAG